MRGDSSSSSSNLLPFVIFLRTRMAATTTPPIANPTRETETAIATLEFDSSAGALLDRISNAGFEVIERETESTSNDIGCSVEISTGIELLQSLEILLE